jgi:hypothetical protein
MNVTATNRCESDQEWRATEARWMWAQRAKRRAYAEAFFKQFNHQYPSLFTRKFCREFAREFLWDWYVRELNSRVPS